MGVNVLNPSNLTDLERVILAILGAGLVPSSVANDPGFRIDYLAAVTAALLRDEPEDAYLSQDGAPAPELVRELSDAIYSLGDRRVLALGAAPANPFINLDGAPPPASDRVIPINFDQHPAVFDRYLAGRCLDELLRHPKVYRFIMDKYADSSEVWQRVYKQYT